MASGAGVVSIFMTSMAAFYFHFNGVEKLTVSFSGVAIRRRFGRRNDEKVPKNEVFRNAKRFRISETLCRTVGIRRN
jgi:hypothetical protein